MDMRTLKYVLGLGLFMLLFTGCDDVDDTPPRLVDGICFAGSQPFNKC